MLDEDSSDDDYLKAKKASKLRNNSGNVNRDPELGKAYLKFILCKDRTVYSNIASSNIDDNYSIHNYLEVPKRKRYKVETQRNQMQGLKFQENDLRFECASIPSCPSVSDRLADHSKTKEC